MGYGYYERPEYFYCPKCGKKKLVKDNQWVGGDYRVIWVCKHNAEPESYRYRRNKKPRGEPCGLVIRHEKRDAKISDYGDALRQMARITVPPIQNWLLEHDTDVHKRALEVLYEGELCDVVRRRHNDDGVAVALYWRACTRDKGGDLANPTHRDYNALRHEAAQYIDFRGLSLSYIFGGNGVLLWQPDDPEPFGTGKGLTKKVKAKIVDWAQELEKKLDDLLQQAEGERARWRREQSAFESAIRKAAAGDENLVTIEHYNGDDKTASVRLNNCIPPRKVLEIGEVLKKEFTLKFYLGNTSRSITPELAILLAETADLHRGMNAPKVTFNINGDIAHSTRRVTLDEAVAIAEILAS